MTQINCLEYGAEFLFSYRIKIFFQLSIVLGGNNMMQW